MKIIAKLFLLINVIFLTITTAKAEPYYGINIGGNLTTIKKNLNYVQTKSTLSSYYTGFRGQLLIGMNFYFFNKDIFSGDANACGFQKEFYFSLEGDIDLNSGSASSSISPWFITTDASVNERQNYGYDIFVLAKYRYAPNINFFLGPGVSWGNFSVSTSAPTGGNLGISGSANTWLSGLSLKAGVEIPLTNYVNLVVTYQLTDFSSQSFSRVEPLTLENVNAQYQPFSNSLTIGVNFNDIRALIFQTNSDCGNVPFDPSQEIVNEPPYIENAPQEKPRAYRPSSSSMKQRPMGDAFTVVGEADIDQYGQDGAID